MEQRNKSENTPCKKEKEKMKSKNPNIHLIGFSSQIDHSKFNIMAKKSSTPAFDKLKAAQSRAQNPSPKKGIESKSDADMKSMRKTALNNISPGMLKPNKKKK